MEYLDFDLEIAPGAGRDYSIAARSQAGEARETMHFPFNELQLQNQLQSLQIALLRSGGKRRLALTKEEETVQQFGRDLFKALFTGEILSRYRLLEREATSQGKGVRLKLRIQQPDMAALPWEFLYDSNRAEYLVLSQETPVVRYLELPHIIQPLPVTLPLRILGMVASPSDLEELDTAREKERVQQAIAPLQAKGLVELTWLEGQTWRDLQKALRRGPWHIFHFIGHGGFHARYDEGLIALCDETTGKAHNFRATELARLLDAHASLRLVLLNACEGARGSSNDIFSSTAAILVRQKIPAVLAMQYEITDRAAIELSRSFYEALAEGLPVDSAVVEARKAISFAVQNSIEWGTPVLYMRSPDGVLFRLAESGQPSAISSQPSAVSSQLSAISSQPSPISSQGAEVEEKPAKTEGRLWEGDLTVLLGQMEQAFNLEELKTLCFELGVGYDDLGGEGKTGKMRELLAYLARRGEVGKLVMQCERKRPKTVWGKVTSQPSTVNSDPPVRSNDFSRPTTEVVTTDSYVDEKTGAVMLRVPAGEFLYGDEKQKRSLPEFWIAKTPVTNAQYQKFIDATPKQPVPSHWDAKTRAYPTDKANHPVVDVSWHDAQAYATWAGVQLPTEEEWEKAARGTDGRIYPWGDNSPTPKLCNFNFNVGDTTPVGNYSPQGDSPYGCVDMSGNVWEWTDSWYGDAREWRVLRGGAWYGYRHGARAACRDYFRPDDRDYHLGFRVVVRRPPSH